MKWFSFIFRHGILVAVVVGIAIAYVYRQQLFPRFFQQDTVTTVASNEASEPSASPAETSIIQAPDDQHATQTSMEEKSASMASDLTSKQTPEVKAIEKVQAVTETEDDHQAEADSGHAMAKSTTLPEDADKAIVAASGPSVADATTQAEGKSSSDAQHSAADKAKASPGIMADPINTMSGMMKNPTQSMSGMMKDPVQSSRQMVVGAEKPQDGVSKQISPAQAPSGQSIDRPIASQPMQTRAPMQAPAANRQPARMQYQQFVSMARQAYWQGQYKQSEDYYKQAIAAEPGNPDTYGELGNVYYAQGEWDESGESLYQSAIRLLDQNRADKAYNLLSIIQGLKHNRGAELESRLQAFQGKQAK